MAILSLGVKEFISSGVGDRQSCAEGKEAGQRRSARFGSRLESVDTKVLSSAQVRRMETKVERGIAAVG